MNFVPILRCANTAGCSSPGISLCSNCHLVKYCSKECQKSHWQEHKKDCKSEFGKKTWNPQWVKENRTPEFITLESGDGTVFTHHGPNKHLWGNTPAFDHVQLLKNEGANWDKPLALCFAGVKASGDLRNVIMSINYLPESYQLPCNVVINDREAYVVLRNLLLLFTFSSFATDEAAEMALHLWYSPKLPTKMVARLRPVFAQKLDKIFTHMARNPSSPPDTLLKAKFELTKKASVVALLPKRFWNKLKTMIDLKVSSQQADDARHLITLSPERRDYRDRHLCLLGPYHRVAKMKYYEDGLVVPFGGVDKTLFVEPNFTTFNTSGEWLLDDSLDPLSCWSHDALQLIVKKHSLPPNDLYGALHFHLIAQFRLFASSLETRELYFTLLGEDARQISTTLRRSLDGISPHKFDRVDVSNTSDAGWIGIETVLSILGDMLRPFNENPNATLITLFLNYVPEMEKVYPKPMMPRSDVMTVIRSLLRREGVDQTLFPKGGLYDPSAVKMVCWDGYLNDCRMPWKEYIEMLNLQSISKKTHMKERTKRTIIEKMPYRVDKDRDSIEEISRKVKHLDVTGVLGHECYVEWERDR